MEDGGWRVEGGGWRVVSGRLEARWPEAGGWRLERRLEAGDWRLVSGKLEAVLIDQVWEVALPLLAQY